MSAKINVGQLQIWLEQTPSKVLDALKNKKNLDAQTLFLQGEAHRLLGSFQPAITTYAKALKVSMQAEERMDILLAMAACYRTLGIAAAAYELADDALKMASELDYEDYVLRAMVVPEGDHTIEFINEAPKLHKNDSITLVISLIMLVVMGGALFMVYRKPKEDKQ